MVVLIVLLIALFLTVHFFAMSQWSTIVSEQVFSQKSLILIYFLFIYFTAIDNRLELGMPCASTSSNTKILQQNAKGN